MEIRYWIHTRVLFEAQENNINDVFPSMAAPMAASRLLPAAQHWTLDTGHWTLDTGHWTPDTGHWTLDTGDTGQFDSHHIRQASRRRPYVAAHHTPPELLTVSGDSR